MKNYLFLAFTSFLISILLANSANSSNELNLENEKEDVIKFSEIENVPIYAGCVGTQNGKPVVVPYSLPINFQAPNQTFVLPSNSR